MATDHITQTSTAWNEIADGYDEFVTPSHFALGDEAVRRAELRAGDSFLDVAAGSGALTIPAARLGARVLATDLAPGMVDRLAKRAAEEGLADVETRVMDGHALQLEDNFFDVAGSQYGVMLFPDLPRAVREMHRVVKPGGRVLVVTFGRPDQQEFLTLFIAAVKAVLPAFPGLPADPPPLEFQVADPSVLRARLEEAGLTSVRVDSLTETLRFRAAHDLWRWLVSSNPIGARLTEGLSPEQQDLTREVLERMLRERANGNEVAELTGPVNIGIGIKEG